MVMENKTYMLDEDWESYYEELQPQKRQEILEENLQALEDDGCNELRRKLFEERYRDPKDPARWVDMLLWKCVYLPGLYKKHRMILFRSSYQKEVDRTITELHLASPETLTDGEKAVLYWEFRNAARRYLGTCNGDRYGRKLLGTKSATPEEKLEYACTDIWMMSRGVALAAGKTENLQLFCDALYDELMCFAPQCHGKYMELEAQWKLRN